MSKLSGSDKSERTDLSTVDTSHFYSTGAALWSLCPLLPDPIERATKRRRLENLESEFLETQTSSSYYHNRIPPDFEPMERASESKQDKVEERFQVKV